MDVRDRIIDFRRVPASELIPHPKNWRRHPREQAAALTGVLQEIGFADAVLVRETLEGLQLIGGHLRQDQIGDGLIPVAGSDVDETDADILLATLDPSLPSERHWGDQEEG